MADELSEDQIHQLYLSFQLLDGDRDGRINATDLQKFMGTFNHDFTLVELEDFIQDETCESNGWIDFPEFVNILLRLVGHALEQVYPSSSSAGPVEVDEQKIEQIFDEWDTDGDGYISSNDLRRIVERMGESWTDEQTLEMIHFKQSDGMLTCNDLKDIILGSTKHRTKNAR